jgi:hypothetical protein
MSEAQNTDPHRMTEKEGEEAAIGSVAVVLATYNGSRFIRQQVESIQRQSYGQWTLYIRDDGSRDDTVAIEQEIAAADHRIRLVQDTLGNQGAIGNFAALMEFSLEAGADYVFFADQDDVWLPEKVSLMLEAMRRLEVEVGKEGPILVHSDLSVVNDELEQRAESFMRYSKLMPVTDDLGVLLCQNRVTGCAAVINRNLLELASPLPKEVLMHDWWLAQLAAAAGRIGFVADTLVKYRQHGGNVLGAISLWSRVGRLLTSRTEWQKFARVVRGSVHQAHMVRARLGERNCEISPATSGRLDAYAKLLSQPRLKRPFVLRKWRIGKPGLAKGWVFNMVVVALKGDQHE